jgi:transketolase
MGARLMGITQSFGDMVAVRDVAGKYISRLGEKNDKVVVVNADLSGTSRNKGFCEEFPHRSFNVGIAEQNLISFSAGLAHEGYMPYAFTMAPFISMRACEQCRTDVAYGHLNVRLIGNYAGYSSGVSGATHCALEDCAIMGSMAGMTVLEPGDPYQICKMLEATLTWDGPVYIRSGIEAIKPIYPEDYDYQIGKAIIAREGGDGAFIASGIVVQFALEAAERLEKDTGAKIRVVDMHTIKPIDEAAVLDAARTGRVIAAQDHNIIGGLGYYAAAVIAQAGVSAQYKILGCPDRFVPIATAPYLFHVNEYDADGLYKNMKKMLDK